MTLDLSLYLVTDPRPGLDGVVAAAVAGGVGIVQVRDKESSTEARTALATRLRSITSASGVPVVVDDDVVAAAAVDGVHVGPGDVHPAEARRTLGSEAIVGWSVDDLDQLADDAALEACTYLAVSPVWSTPTKPDHGRPWGLEGLRSVVAAVDGRLPVLGIGGIDAGNAASVMAAGAAGVCVVSAICAADDPLAAATALHRTVTEAAG